MHVRLHAEYECHPLWIVEEDGLVNVDPYTVSWISNSLAERIGRWGDVYEETYKHDDAVGSGFASLKDKQAFDATGERLWEELREALGDDHKVEHFSVLRGWLGR